MDVLNWWVPDDARYLKQEMASTEEDEKTGADLKKKFGTYKNLFKFYGLNPEGISIEKVDIKDDNTIAFVNSELERLPRGYIPQDFKGTIYINKNIDRTENERWADIAHEMEHLLNSAKGFGRSESRKYSEGHFANVKHLPYERPKDTDKIPKGIQSELPKNKKGKK